LDKYFQLNTLIKKISGYCFILFLIPSCNKLDSIDYNPLITPSAFLHSQNYFEIHLAGYNFIWSQPSSTFIVYFVGAFAMYAGYRFLLQSNHNKARYWWGVGLLLTGLGALFAGTSYQAFGYEIKCASRLYCTYTSWWEVIYLLLSVPGMNAFLIATSHTNFTGRFRWALISYATINTIVYSTLLFYGALSAQRFLVSFDFLVLVSAPSVLFLLTLHAFAYYRKRDSLNLTLLYGWLIFVVVGLFYGIYMSLEITQQLWQRGVWFTENDVLHIGMICWVYYLYHNLPNKLKSLD